VEEDGRALEVRYKFSSIGYFGEKDPISRGRTTSGTDMASSAENAKIPKPAWAAVVKAVSGGGAGEVAAEHGSDGSEKHAGHAGHAGANAPAVVAAVPQQNGKVGDTAAKVSALRPSGLTTAAEIVKGVASASSASPASSASSAVPANTSAVEVGTPGQLAKEKGSKGSPERDENGNGNGNGNGKEGSEGAALDNVGDGAGEGAGAKEGASSEPKKPVWKVVKEPEAEVPVPAVEGGGGQVWPTLADTKEPLPKKEQRKLAEQQAAAAAAANKDQASTSGADAGQKSKSQGKREKKGSKAALDAEGKGKSRSRRGKPGKSGDSDNDGAGGQGAGQGGGKQKRGGQGKSRGMMQKGMPPVMPYGIAAPMMYAPQTPVFYPPAAYGVASNVDMVMDAIRKQIDFYFSEENLVKDMYLRGKMDAAGWVEMATIAAFNRVRMLTPDLSIISQSLETSSVIEISPDGLFLRAREGHEKWVLPVDQRDPNIRSPVDPAVLAAQAELNASEGKKKKKSKAGDAGANAKGTSNTSHDDGDDVFQLDEEHDGASQAKKPSNNKLSKLIVVKPSSTQKSALSAQLEASKNGNTATHADIHAGLEQYGHELRKPSGGRNAESNAVNTTNPRPMANGRHKHANFYPSSVGHSFMANKHHGKGGRAHGGPVGWVLGSTPDAHSPRFMSPTNRRGSYLGSSAPISKFQHPSYELLEENGFTEIKYEKFHDRCIQERVEKGVGLSEEMNTLFRFWCYFLRDHFEEVMYEDFKKYALADSEQGYHYGIECLFRFFSYGLESHFDAKLYKEFEEYVLLDHKGGHLYGLEKFWAYHHYHGLPKDCGFEMHPKLKQLLESDFKTIDDFKARREANLHRSS